jgi:hypothetical protein
VICPSILVPPSGKGALVCRLLFLGDYYVEFSTGLYRLPLPIVPEWMVLAIDMEQIITRFCTQPKQRGLQLLCIKVRFCETMLVDRETSRAFSLMSNCRLCGRKTERSIVFEYDGEGYRNDGESIVTRHEGTTADLFSSQYV